MATTMSIAQKKEIIRKNGGNGKGNILGILLDFQRLAPEGYIDMETASFVAEELGLTNTRVYEIASYYAMLQVKPQAKFAVEVCNSSPCQFSQADNIVGTLERELGISLGQATPDGMFSLHYTPCVGACEIGPVIKIGDTVYGNLSEGKILRIIDELRLSKAAI